MNITRVVVDTDGYEGPVSEELEPIPQQLGWDEVTEPAGQLLILPHHRGDVGQAWRREISLHLIQQSLLPTCDQSDTEYWWG